MAFAGCKGLNFLFAEETTTYIEVQRMCLKDFRKEKLMGKRASIRKAKQRLLEEMEKLDQSSPEYSKLATELEKLTKSELNQYGWIGQLGCGVAQTLISAVSSTVNVWSVLKHEDRGNVVTTKSLNYAPKPQEHGGNLKNPR